jgi:hypothetical protein
MSFFHDVTYIIQEYNKGIGDFLNELLNIDFSILIDWSKMFSDEFKYTHDLIKITNMFTSTKGNTNKHNLLSRYFQAIEFKQDHGVISALLLMKQLLRYNIEEANERDTSAGMKNASTVEVYLAALAISMHTAYVFHELQEGSSTKLSFESFPLEFLLVYCDTAQEWGRKKKVDGGTIDGPILRAITLEETRICTELEYPTENAPSVSTLKRLIQEKTECFCSSDCSFSLEYHFIGGDEPLRFDFSIAPRRI